MNLFKSQEAFYCVLRLFVHLSQYCQLLSLGSIVSQPYLKILSITLCGGLLLKFLPGPILLSFQNQVIWMCCFIVGKAGPRKEHRKLPETNHQSIQSSIVNSTCQWISKISRFNIRQGCGVQGDMVEIRGVHCSLKNGKT